MDRKDTLRLVHLARKKAELLAVLATDIPTYGLAPEEARELVEARVLLSLAVASLRTIPRVLGRNAPATLSPNAAYKAHTR